MASQTQAGYEGQQETASIGSNHLERVKGQARRKPELGLTHVCLILPTPPLYAPPLSLSPPWLEALPHEDNPERDAFGQSSPYSLRH
jgi:hypothetical protein